MADLKKPNPGSTEARALGCVCPIIDNNHGRGYRGNPDTFVWREDCPMHGEEAAKLAGDVE